jgi:hypothetical protein
MARTSGTRKLIKEGMQKLALEGLGAEGGAGAPGGTGYVPIGAGLWYVNDGTPETQKTKNGVISELLNLYQRFTVWSLISTSTTST